MDGPLEEQEKPVGLVHFDAGVALEDPSGQLVVLLEDLGRARIAQPLGQPGGVDQIHHQERPQRGCGGAGHEVAGRIGRSIG